MYYCYSAMQEKARIRAGDINCLTFKILRICSGLIAVK